MPCRGGLGLPILVAARCSSSRSIRARLRELLDVDAAALVEELERLCERRILRVDGLRFRFRYELVRQVLLESISPARRRLLRESGRLDLERTLSEPDHSIGSRRV